MEVMVTTLLFVDEDWIAMYASLDAEYSHNYICSVSISSYSRDVRSDLYCRDEEGTVRSHEIRGR